MCLIDNHLNDCFQRIQMHDFKVTDVKFNQQIPDYIFTKAALKK
jgi:hypothetical protein